MACREPPGAARETGIWNSPEVAMKTVLFVFITLVLLLLAPVAAADLTAMNGTWSGNWTPKGGVPDAITVELKTDESGKIAGNLEPMIPRAKSGSSSGLSSAANGLGTRLRTFFRIANLPWPAFRRPLQSDASMH